MIRRPPSSTLPDPLCPYTTLFRSRLDQVYLPGVDPQHLAAVLDPEFGDPLALALIAVIGRAPFADAGEGARQPLGRHRLEQIVDGGDVKGGHRIAVEGGHEDDRRRIVEPVDRRRDLERSEEHTSEIQSLMRITYAVFCLKKKKNKK